MDRDVAVERRGAGLWVRVDRPGQGNALAPTTVAALSEALNTVPDDVRAVVITGTGSVFCAGADVRAAGERMAEGEAEILGFMDAANALLDRIEALPVPTIAAVNGTTRAGGLELMLACDMAIATHETTIGDAHVTHGFVPAWGGTARLPERVPRGLAARLFVTGDALPASELVASGLVTEVVADGHLVDHVDGIVARIAAGSASAVTAVVQLLRKRPDRSRAQAVAAERQAFRQQLAHPDLHAGVAAFAPQRQ